NRADPMAQCPTRSSIRDPPLRYRYRERSRSGSSDDSVLLKTRLLPYAGLQINRRFGARGGTLTPIPFGIPPSNGPVLPSPTRASSREHQNLPQSEAAGKFRLPRPMLDTRCWILDFA